MRNNALLGGPEFGQDLDAVGVLREVGRLEVLCVPEDELVVELRRVGCALQVGEVNRRALNARPLNVKYCS